MAVDEGNSQELITLKVQGQDNSDYCFTIEKQTPLKILMNDFCEKRGLAMATVRFRFDGKAISEADTPSLLEMKEGDVIEVNHEMNCPLLSNAQEPIIYNLVDHDDSNYRPTIEEQTSLMKLNANIEKKNSQEQITLKVLGQDESVVQFKIKKHIPLKKLMIAYCENKGLPLSIVRFYLDGRPISDIATPLALELEEGQTIDAYLEMGGPCEMQPTSQMASNQKSGIGIAKDVKFRVVKRPIENPNLEIQNLVKKLKPSHIEIMNNRCDESCLMMKNVCGSSTNTEEKDECALYADLLAVKLRSLNDHTRAFLMHNIDTLIFNAKYKPNPKLNSFITIPKK